MADNLYNNYGSTIKDRTTFDKAFDSYFQSEITNFDRPVSQIKNKVFRELRRDHPEINSGRIYQPKATATAPRVKPKRFKYTGKIKNKVVFARKIRTSRGFRYIDQRGRYVSLKK